MNNYATHLPILQLILETCDVKNVFEYGMGSFSTILFVNNCKNVIAVEMQDDEWFSKMSLELQALDQNNYSLLSMIGPTTAIEYFNSLQDHHLFDLVFVDGHGETRPECINEAMKANIPYIVTHDTEYHGYGWDRVELKPDYLRIEIRKYTPWTTVFTRDLDLLKALQAKFG